MYNSSCSSTTPCHSDCRSILMFFGRLGLATIFVLAGVGKFLDPEMNLSYMASKGLGGSPFLLYAAAVVEIMGGLLLMIGFKTRWAAILLALFLIPTTASFHDFWQVGEVEASIQKIHFLKNLAIFGGLLYVIASGAGSWSIDRCCYKKQPKSLPK